MPPKVHLVRSHSHTQNFPSREISKPRLFTEPRTVVLDKGKLSGIEGSFVTLV